MKETIFKDELLRRGIQISEEQMAQFSTYFHMLVEWNEKINLTAITAQNDVYLKHFYDSLTPSFYDDFTKLKSICDIGAGAGFPSIPLKICFPHLQVTIVDSLQKRINFLKELVAELGLDQVNLIHSRAEEVGRQATYRESFDLVTARAVARMSVLSEYCLPLCRKGGHFLALKAANAAQELQEGQKAIEVLGGQVVRKESFKLPKEESERTLIWIKKVKASPKKYPRKPGTPNRTPIQ